MPTGRDILDATRLLCTRALKVKSDRSCLEGATSSSSESSLKRELGALDLIFFGIGGVVGAGVFVLTGAAAQVHAGPAVVISYLLATITSLITATAYTEFATQIPVTGSAYNYIALTFGEYIAFITGCNLALELTIAGAAVACGDRPLEVEDDSLICRHLFRAQGQSPPERPTMPRRDADLH